jgi:hypothetical protein
VCVNPGFPKVPFFSRVSVIDDRVPVFLADRSDVSTGGHRAFCYIIVKCSWFWCWLGVLAAPESAGKQCHQSGSSLWGARYTFLCITVV